jgi:hypothetical protein
MRETCNFQIEKELTTSSFLESFFSEIMLSIMLGTSGINITTHAIVKIKDTSKCIDTHLVLIVIYVVKQVGLNFVW